MTYKTTLVVENGHTIVLKEYGLRETTGNISSSLLLLSDTPSTYAGAANFALQVNADGTGIEFVENTGGVGNVISVFGRDGVVEADATDYDEFYANITHTHTESDITDLDKYTKSEVDAAVAGATSDVVDDLTPQLGGELDLNTNIISSPTGSDMIFDVKGMSTGDEFKVMSDGLDIFSYRFDSTESEFILDLSGNGETRVIGLPTNQDPIPSEALSYQYLIDKGVLNPMVGALNAGQNNIVNTKVMYFGDEDAPGGSQFGVSNDELAVIPAISTTAAVGYTTEPLDNTLLLVPEVGQPIAVSGDAGNSITLRYPSLDGTENQVLTTDGAGTATWVDSQDPDLDFGTFEGEDTDNFVGFLTEVEDDQAPVLGGSLDTNGNNITSSSGPLLLNSISYPSVDGTDGQSLVTDGSGNLTFATITGGTGSSDWADITNKPTEFTPEAHTHVKTDITDFNESDYATSAQGDLADSAVQEPDLDYGTFEGEDTDNFMGFLTQVEDDIAPVLGGSLDTNGKDIISSSGTVLLNSLSYPNTDGTDGQSLVTNGAGVLEFRTITGGGGGSSDWADITNKPTEFTPSVHTHLEADITDLDKYTQAEVDAAIGAIQGFSGSYDDLTEVPTDFTPSVHTHLEADITDLDKYTQAEVDAAIGAIQGFSGSYDDLTEVPTEFTPSVHTHLEADITDLDKYTVAEVDALVDPVAIKTAYESNLDTNAFTDNAKSYNDLIQDLGEFTGETISPNVDVKVALQNLETELERQAPFDANITLVEDFYEAVDAGVTHNTQIPQGTITNKTASAGGRSIGFNYVNGTQQQFKLAFNETFTEPYLWGGDGSLGEANATWMDVDLTGLVKGAAVTITFFIRRATSTTPRSCTWTRDPNGAAELMFSDNGSTADVLETLAFTASGPTETLRIFLQRVMLKEITVNVQGTYSSSRLTDSSDVNIMDPVLDNVLAYTANNRWENVPIANISASNVLSSLVDGSHGGPELLQFIVDAVEEKLLTEQRVIKNTTVRPADPDIGDQYFDPVLNKALWWAGAQWIDNDGKTR